MVGVEPDSSLHYEPSDAVPEKLYELVVRPESEVKKMKRSCCQGWQV